MINPIEARPDEWELYQPLVGKRMLELGGKVNPQAGWTTYKSYFESIGFEHLSIDWEGEKYGALNRDLRKPQWPEFGCEWDMVSNMGTTEHVSDQRAVWENIHMLTRPGGVYVGQTPYHDGLSWWWHGDWYPTEAWYHAFAALNGWEIERLYKGREVPNQNLYCRMTKRESRPFECPDLGLIVRNVRRPR